MFPDPEFDDHIVVKRSTRAKRLALRLDAQSRVFTLVVPQRMSLKRAQRFAEENESWMQEQLAELAPPIYLEDQVRIPILGHETLIQIEHDERFKRTKITLEDHVLHVRTNQDAPAMRIRRYLKTLAKEKFTTLAHEKAARIDKVINDIKVRDTKSRWGSCSEDNNLNFSWRLIFAPYAAIDYVVGHEVAHLEHLDHSKEFWTVCRELSDDFVEGQYWMKAHGHELMRYV